MCGSTRSTTSPSSSSTRRSTPCAAGCCGPKLMVKFRIAASVIASRLPRAGKCRKHFRPGHVLRLVGKVVVRRLLVDEDLRREREAALVVDRLGRNGAKVPADQAIEQRGAALLAEAALGPLGRAIHAKVPRVLDLERAAALEREHRPGSP